MSDISFFLCFIKNRCQSKLAIRTLLVTEWNMEIVLFGNLKNSYREIFFYMFLWGTNVIRRYQRKREMQAQNIDNIYYVLFIY